ncbi:glycosyltransferase family 4 protein [Sphingomonas sp. LB-2]|uniref:glycosyltransferase family 4 protein n=1 Tax=Sphingomonas caeni TaxID=2984949 RepID=UPI00222E9A54|nr:glycosyltransferase family 4 protein [Sphingomonas caeni]MCW3849317.1 glycosyltransferase family 4 protein [Sphingomonas caeni]
MPIHILHLHSTFNLGGKEARAVQLMNAFGDRARHTIVSAMPDQLSARDAIANGIKYEIAQDPPPLSGRPSIRRYEDIARFMRRFDLVLTYNWGAIDGVMAARVFGKGLPPIVHHEDGFNADEAIRLNIMRNTYRRMALPAANALVVPSGKLEAIAMKHWGQPAERLRRIPNGIKTELYGGKPVAGAIPGFRKKPGEIVIGSIAGLRPVKDLPLLVRSVAGMSTRARLVIVGEGAERAKIEETARLMALEDQLVMPGFLPDPHRYIGHFDIFALSSKSEQAPISVIEAMAAGLPVMSTWVGDIPNMVAPENADYLAPHNYEIPMRDRLEMLAKDAGLRSTVGEANRKRARALFGERNMVAAYAELYAAAMGRPGVLG